MSPKGEESAVPVLRLGGQSWDLSNLYPRGKVPKELLTTIEPRKNRSKCRPRRKSKPEASLYPNLNELDDALFDLEPAAEAFRKAPKRSNSPPEPPTSQPGAFHSVPGSNAFTRTCPSSPRRSSAVPGAFPSVSSPPRPKPPLPSWVESPDKLARKMKGKCVLGESSSYQSTSQTSLQSDTPYVDIYRQESMRSVQSTYSAGPARAEEEDDNTRSRIEVAPGHYMPLRGSAETMAAVESGMARTVSCMACQARLLCVPDAELVICPDCRLLSPLPEDKMPFASDWQGHSRTTQCGTPPGAQYQVGGVGLGLKVEANRV